MIKKLIILDYMHLAYAVSFGGAVELTTTIRNDKGLPEIIKTTLLNAGLKWVTRRSNWGEIPVAICFDGGSVKRKERFSSQGILYKEGRKKLLSSVYVEIDRLRASLNQGGVSTYYAKGIEADDFIGAIIAKVREEDKLTGDTTIITIFTGDADMLPYVDENTLVYKRSNGITEARSKEEQIKSYRQFTVETYEGILPYLTDYKGYTIPYNAIYLFKLLKGDKADNIPSIKIQFGAKRFNLLIDRMKENGIDFANTFRYGVPKETILDAVLPSALEIFDAKVAEAILAQIDLVWDGYQVEPCSVVLPERHRHHELEMVACKYGIKLPMHPADYR